MGSSSRPIISEGPAVCGSSIPSKLYIDMRKFQLLRFLCSFWIFRRSQLFAPQQKSWLCKNLVLSCHSYILIRKKQIIENWRWFWVKMQRLPPTKTPCFVSYPFLESIVNNPCEDKNLSSLRGGGLQSSSLCLDEINLDEVTKGNSTANGGEKDQGSVSQNAPLKPSL